MKPVRPHRIVLVLLSGLAGTAQAAPQPTAELGWTAVQDLMFAEALSVFRSEPITNSRTARLGQAVSILHKQPTTRGNLKEALDRLETLIREDPGSEEARQAAYLRARVTELHPFEPDPEAAVPLYRALAKDAPQTLIGQLAFLKWAGLELYSPEKGDEDVDFDTIEVEGEFLEDPDCRRSFHLLLAEAGQRRHHEGDFVLRHYLSAYDAGLVKPDLRANVLTRIIVLAQKLGRSDTARTHAAVFIATFPRDVRITQIKELLADMEGPKE